MVRRNQKCQTARERLILGGALDPVQVLPKSLPVRMDQLDGLGENRLFRLRESVTGCCVSLRCLTDEAGVPIVGVRLELELPDFEFRWLDESEGDEYSYRCGPDYQFPREHVINNKIPGVLYRGKGWTGWLVGVSCQPLPRSINGTIAGNVFLYDAFGRTAGVEVALMIEPFTQKKTVPKPRAGLFEPYELDLEKQY